MRGDGTSNDTRKSEKKRYVLRQWVKTQSYIGRSLESRTADKEGRARHSERKGDWPRKWL